MEQLSIILLSFIEKNNSTKIEDKNIVLFGLKIVISTLIDIFVIVTIGIGTRYTIETILYLCVFGFLKGNAGGYHAKSLNKCLLLTTSTYIFTLILAELDIWVYKKVVFIVFIAVANLVLSLAPIETVQNKMPKKNVKLRKRRLVFIVLLIEIIYILTTYNKEIYFIIMAAIWSGLTVVVSKLYN